MWLLCRNLRLIPACNKVSIRQLLQCNRSIKQVGCCDLQQKLAKSCNRLLVTGNVRFMTTDSLLNLNKYHQVSEDTMEELADCFDNLGDQGLFGDDYDLTLADGVMTVKLGVAGTYVINKQTPNRQIWLSSPISGPKRYDFVDDTWQYSHEPEVTLHILLSRELSEVTKQDIDFTQLAHGSTRTS